MASIKIVLVKHKQKKNGTFPIAFRIIKNRKPSYIFTGEYILAKHWDDKTEKVKKSYPNSTRLNNFLLKKLSEIHNTVIESNTHSHSDTVSEIKKKVVASKKQNDFFDVAQLHLQTVKERKKYSQHNTDEGRIKIFKDFIGKSKLPMSEVTVTLLTRFQNYLLHSKGNAPRTVMNYFILIRTIYNIAISKAMIDRREYPFGKGKIQIKFLESEKIGLSKEEVVLLENAESLTRAEQHAVNVWLISFYFAGMRVSDVLLLKWSDFKSDRLYYRMNKNEKLVSLKIPEKAKLLLEEYKQLQDKKLPLVFKELNGTDLENKERLTVRIKTVTRNLNRRLKQVAEKLEIEKNISMHIARHTFGNISGSAIPIQVLQKLYRHSSITTTINYQKNFIHEETDAALDKVINF